MVEIPIDIVVKKGLVDGGEVRVARLTGDKARGRARYVIYLPTSRKGDRGSRVEEHFA